MRGRVVTVFCASKITPGGPLARQAYRLGAALARAGFTVCNGGYGGAMAESARGAKAAGGATIGITVDQWGLKANRWIDRQIHARSILDRLVRLMEMGDGYAVLPGGSGTLLELAAVWEYQNKKLLPPKPIILVGNFWLPLVREARRAFRRVGQSGAASLISVAPTPEAAVALLRKSNVNR
ncbi:MAG: LOG family protein [bacterium]